MNQRKLMNHLDAVIEEAKAGVLAVTDGGGRPHLYWLTPTTLRRRRGRLFCFTRPGAEKIGNLEQQPEVEWMIQTRALTKIINVRGNMTVVDNPALKSEIVEHLGRRLTMFWKVDVEQREVVVLETAIREAVYYLPMQGVKETVVFTEEGWGDE